MQSALYVGLSAQVALEKRLQTIANNVANVNTTAFRTDVVKFETVLSRAGANPVAFSSPGGNIISREAGNLTETGNPLDVAVVGQGWLAFAGPSGTVYTRDGRLQIAANGDLQTLTGFPVVDSGGAQITVDPNGGPLSIARSGAIKPRSLWQFGRDPRSPCHRCGRFHRQRLPAELCGGIGGQSDARTDPAHVGVARLRQHEFTRGGHGKLPAERDPDARRTRQVSLFATCDESGEFV